MNESFAITCKNAALIDTDSIRNTILQERFHLDLNSYVQLYIYLSLNSGTHLFLIQLLYLFYCILWIKFLCLLLTLMFGFAQSMTLESQANTNVGLHIVCLNILIQKAYHKFNMLFSHPTNVVLFKV